MSKASSKKKDKEVTDKDLFESIPPPMDFDPFAGIDIESLTGKKKQINETLLTIKNDNETDEETSDLVTDRPSDLVTQRPSDLPTNPQISLVTQRPSDIVTDLVAQGPSDLVTYRPSDLVTQGPSDPVAPITQKEKSPSKPSDLTERQFKVLKYIYFNRPFKVYSNQGIGAIDGMGPNNAKNQLRSLSKKGYIYKPFSVNNGVHKGSNCRVNEGKCMPIFGPSPIPNPEAFPPQNNDPVTQGPSDPVTYRHSDLVTQRPSDPVTDLEGALISSSSLFKKTTTMRNFQTDIEKAINEIMTSDPEYSFWIDEQVLPQQILKWKNEFGVNLETILNNLCYVRWQIIHQKAEVKKSAANMLYGIMKKNGGVVNKPAGYKSMAQLDLEFFESWQKQRQENVLKIERIKKESIQAEIEPKVSAILMKPQADNVYFRKALERIHSKKRQQEILQTVENGRNLDDNLKSALRGYLVQVFEAEAMASELKTQI